MHPHEPRTYSDKLKSYGAAKREILAGVAHRQSRYLNNRCENSHRPTRQREYRLQGFTSPGQAQRFCPRMDPSPNIANRDATCYRGRGIVQRGGTVSSVGPRARGRSGRPKRRVGGNCLRKAPSVAWCQDHPQQLDNALWSPNTLHRPGQRTPH
jgi:hypothetical protein